MKDPYKYIVNVTSSICVEAESQLGKFNYSNN